MNSYTASRFDPRHSAHASSPLAQLRQRQCQANPDQMARAIRSAILWGRWTPLSARLGAALRGTTVTRPSSRFPGTLAEFDRATGEFLGWRGERGFCPAGEA